MSFPILESQYRLEPLTRVKLLFRPAAEFARRHGIEIPVGLRPFEREYYLQAREK